MQLNSLYTTHDMRLSNICNNMTIHLAMA